MSPPSGGTSPELSPDVVLGEVAKELQREDAEVLYPLMARINELADALAEGRAVDPEYIENALRLWGRYVGEMHQSRLQRLFAIVRGAPEMSRTSARSHLRLTDRLRGRPRHAPPPAPESVEAQYAEIRGTQMRMAQRLAVLEGLVGAYRRGEFFSAQMLASLLRSGAFSDRAWGRYEEQFVLKSLGEHLGAEEDLRLHQEVLSSDALRNQVEGEVRAFLSKPLVFRTAPA